ncbi:MAG: lysophospholipid acyltransferase family protein [Chromatiaceae bacterium]
MIDAEFKESNPGDHHSGSGLTAPARSGRRTSPAWKEWLLEGVARGMALLPFGAAQALGWLTGTLLVLIPNKQRRNALVNLRLCRPDWSEAQARRFRNCALREESKTFIEIAYLLLRPVPRVLALIRETHGLECLERGQGRGLIVLSPHLGAWELAGLYLSTRGPTTTLYKPQPLGDVLVRQARARGGADLVPTDNAGIRRLLQALRRGEYLGILPDQEPKAEKGSVFAPFFGVPALTMLLVNRLARKTGAPVVFLFARRLPWGRGFALHCLPAPDGVDAEDDETAARALNQGVEACVAICPEQYVWSYKRFRTRPDGGPHPYHGPC